MSYLEFYKLKREPFHITPDPEFLYLSPSHKEALGVFLYGVRQRKGIIAVTGEVGVGKTTVLRRYLETVDSETLKPIYLFNSNISFQELVKMLHEELGISVSGSSISEMVYTLHYALIQKYKEGQNVVLIVDEAQNMPDETLENLRMLSNLETAKDKLLQIALIGQPELDEKLNLHKLRQLRQRVAVRATIQPLSEEESSAYIESRLQKCTDSNERIFSDRAVQTIVKEAQGIPRTINILCDNALITGYGYEQKPISHKIIKEVISDFRGNLHPTKRKYSIGWVMGIFLFLLALSGIAWMTNLTPSHLAGGGSALQSADQAPAVNRVSVPVSGHKPAAKQSPPMNPASEMHANQNQPSTTAPAPQKMMQASSEQKQPSLEIEKTASPAPSRVARQPNSKPSQAALIRRQQRPSEPVATPKQIASKSPQPQETSNRAATADAPDDASSEAEAQKKTEIAKELEVERGRKIQLLLQAQQQSAIEAARERVEPDSTQDRVAPAQITQPPQKPETSTSTLLENPKPAIDSSNTQSVPDNKPASPTDSQSQRGSKVLDATAKPEIRPVLTHIVRPVYPRSFRGRNVDGSVLLSILVSQRGEVEAIRVVHGIAGYPEFTSQAINAVRQWKFRPAIDHGVRVKSWVSCPIVFRRN